MAEPELDIKSIVEETIEFVTVRPDGDGWVGDAPDWFGERLFGGFVLSQSVHAVTRTAPDGGRIHSLHGYFLRPVFAGKPLTYRVASLREGRTFVMRRLEAVQDGEPVFTMMCSFTADTDGYEYEFPIDGDVPDPDEIDATVGPGPWVAANLGPTPPAPDGARTSTRGVVPSSVASRRVALLRRAFPREHGRPRRAARDDVRLRSARRRLRRPGDAAPAGPNLTRSSSWPTPRT